MCSWIQFNIENSSVCSVIVLPAAPPASHAQHTYDLKYYTTESGERTVFSEISFVRKSKKASPPPCFLANTGIPAGFRPGNTGNLHKLSFFSRKAVDITALK